jgi:glycosyltransferase involved in cell wall biosynthesis
MIRIVTVTSLYPNAEMPDFGIFVENRLRHLRASGEVEARVIAPVPWFPFPHALFGSWAKWARVPPREQRHGIEICHPRYPNLPKIGMNLAPFFMGWAIKRALKKLAKNGYAFDLVDAHYFYPDGVAAVRAARALKKPVVVTARGSDLNLIANFKGPARLIRRAAHQASGLITVSDALKQKLVKMGVSEEAIRVLRNGVDLEAFHLEDKTALRRKLDLEGQILLSVGNLVVFKGHDIAIKALALLPGVKLLIAGAGPEEAALRVLADAPAIQGRVTFLGRIPHGELAPYYGAADALVLASAREGMANVLLEAMACGTPVIAADIPGMDEVVGPPGSGLLMSTRTPAGLAEAARTLFASFPDRKLTRRYAESFNWQDTTAGQIRLFKEIIGRK